MKKQKSKRTQSPQVDFKCPGCQIKFANNTSLLDHVLFCDVIRKQQEIIKSYIPRMRSVNTLQNKLCMKAEQLAMTPGKSSPGEHVG